MSDKTAEMLAELNLCAGDILAQLEKPLPDMTGPVVKAINGLRLEAPVVNVPAPVVNVEAPVVNVPAPIVNVPPPERRAYTVTITSRDGNGLIRTFLFEPKE